MKIRTILEASYALHSAKEVSFRKFKSIAKDDDGLVLLGAGGDLNDWIKGVSSALHEEGIATSDNPSELWSAAYVLTTSGGRTDLALMFNDKNNIDIGKLAMWRLKFGDASWVSDYIVNYAKQH